jgi:predicted short-subunit dehydrogenase-like oxidoreductase (DUF2520 family)
MSSARQLSVFVLGRGKVGSGLARALRRAGANVTLRAARGPLPRGPIAADLVVLAARDGYLPALATELAAASRLDARCCVVHCAGALGPEVLAPLRPFCRGVAQMHPMIAFASAERTPDLLRGQVHLAGDAAAVRLARRVARLLRMTPRTVVGLDRVLYHAAAGLVANGAAALAAAGAELLAKAGVSDRAASQMLGPLLRSVGDNVERLGMPAALTGPVRRGDAAGVGRHLDVLAGRAPALVPLYRALVAAQLPLARALGEAEPGAFDDIELRVSRPKRARRDS